MRSRTRDPQATKSRILRAARDEFAAAGLGGARVDNIADRARVNKRMIYHYFENKEDLFTAVVEDAYLALRAAERELNLDQLEPTEALDQFVKFTWQYYLDHPEFLTLVNSENLHQGRHIEGSKRIRNAHRGLVSMVEGIIERGVASGVFREGIDAVQLNITIAAIGYYYLTNRFTGSVIYRRDLMTSRRLKERLAFNLDTIQRLTRA